MTLTIRISDYDTLSVSLAHKETFVCPQREWTERVRWIEKLDLIDNTSFPFTKPCLATINRREGVFQLFISLLIDMVCFFFG